MTHAVAKESERLNILDGDRADRFIAATARLLEQPSLRRTSVSSMPKSSMYLPTLNRASEGLATVGPGDGTRH